MQAEEVDIRELLIERIMELRRDKAKATDRYVIRTLEELELFNINLYYKIFGSRIT